MGRRAATAVAGIALLVAGCSGGGQGPDAPDGGSESPSSSPSSGASSPSDTPEPVPTPTVEPATGVEVEVRGFRINAPKKWRITNSVVIAATAVGPVDGGRSGAVLLGTSPTDQVSIAQAMRNSWKPGARPPGFEEQPRTVLAGLSAFYYTADSGRFLTEHVMGMWDSGYTIELNIGLPHALAPDRQKEIVDSIVATFRSPRDG